MEVRVVLCTILQAELHTFTVINKRLDAFHEHKATCQEVRERQNECKWGIFIVAVL